MALSHIKSNKTVILYPPDGLRLSICALHHNVFGPKGLYCQYIAASVIYAITTELGKFIYLLPSGSLKVKCPVNTQISLDLPHYHIITWPQLFAQLFCFLKTVGNCYHDLSDSQC